MKNLTILTEKKFLLPANDNFSKQVLLEDNYLVAAFEKVGIACNYKAWDDLAYDWRLSEVVIIRSTWDYSYRLEEYQNQLRVISQGSKLINSYDTVSWNIDKNYLFELNNKGINIAKGTMVTKNNFEEVFLNLNKTEIETFVLKPRVSAGGRNTEKIARKELLNNLECYRQIINQEDYILQEFQYNVESNGELSLIFMGGQFTHAVLKEAKKGDFRVQDDFGGTVNLYKASSQEKSFAQEVINQLPHTADYSRVDIFYDNQNQLALAEIELIEPELFFRFHPASAEILAKVIKKRYYGI